MTNPYLAALGILTVVLGLLSGVFFLFGLTPQNIEANVFGGVALNLFWWSLLATLVLGGVTWKPTARSPQASGGARRAPGDERPQWMIDGRERPDRP